MSDTLRCYRSIRAGLHQLYPEPPKGRVAHSLNTLSWMICGIVQSGQTQLPAIASRMPECQRESRVKQLSRFLKNDHVEERCSYLPFAKQLLRVLSKRLPRLTLVIDGSQVGRGCRALMVSVVFQGRTLPLAYHVESGPKGHFGEAEHVKLIEAVKRLVPEGMPVVVLGDGEFDGVGLLAKVKSFGWDFVCRTAKNSLLSIDGERGPFAQVGVQPGEVIPLFHAYFTAARYGPVGAVAAWRDGCKEPIYLVTNLGTAEEALRYYAARFRIETLFSDQKSRGFHLHKSHLSDPKRIARLMIACCLAYVWLVFLGQTAQEHGWMSRIHRKTRCDLSLFQLGKALLFYLLAHSLSIPVDFLAPPHLPAPSVRC